MVLMLPDAPTRPSSACLRARSAPVDVPAPVHILEPLSTSM